MWTRRNWVTLAALSGFIAIAMGAFAAHGITDPKAKAWLQTGAQYEFMHTMGTLACIAVINAGGRLARHAPAFFLGGTVLFSGSLYAMAFGAPRIMGAITPIGGVMFLIGWAILVVAARKIDQATA
jgi:hypothetical protein